MRAGGRGKQGADSIEPCGLWSRVKIFFSELLEANGKLSAGWVYGLISVDTQALEWGIPTFKTKSGTVISEHDIHPLTNLGPT